MADTIFALATGAGRAAIAVVRISGSAASAALSALAGPLPSPRRAALRRIADPATGAVIDQALVLWFPGPASVTGEDLAEVHCHGGRAVVAALLGKLGAQPGCRPAQPGEFTRRAFLNGRMDLAEVEGLADLIDAETDAQRRQALRQMEGALAGWVDAQRGRLVTALAAAESAIDFSDEADVAGDFARELHAEAMALRGAIRAELDRSQAAMRVREGLVVALTGPPNAGKSTLLNALVRRDVAIVSPQPGTTRDPVAVSLDLGGYLVEVVDTAGIRTTDDPIEREGVARALSRAESADVVLWLTDARHPSPPEPALRGRMWRVVTKTDLASKDVAGFDYAISAHTGAGVGELIAGLKQLIEGDAAGDGGVMTRERHRTALLRADKALSVILDCGPEIGLELAAEHLRHAAVELDGLIGRVTTEDVLGAIFARFCVGK